MAELQTLSKALDILLLLGDSSDKISVEDISKFLEIPESTTYRLLQTLEKKGFVERENRGTVTLGYSILNLARDIYEKMDRQLSIAALPVMERLTEQTAETSLLSVRSSLYSTVLVSVPCKERIRFVGDEMRLLPIHLGASGRAILAFENEKIIRQVLSHLEREEEKTLLKERITTTKKCGYAVSHAEYDEGSLGIGVPIFDRRNKVCASLSVVAPIYRVPEKNIEAFLVPKLLEAAEEIACQLLP